MLEEPTKSLSLSKRASIAILFLCLSGGVHATIVRIDALPRMSHNADIIAHVLVGDKEIRKEPNGRAVELSRLEVVDGLKGAKSGDILTVFQVAGVIGQSHFRFGEELVLFGMKHRDMVVGYGVGLGKFRVLREGNKIAVVEDLQNVIALGSNLKARSYPSLSLFKSTIEESLKAPWQVVPVGALRKKEARVR